MHLLCVCVCVFELQVENSLSNLFLLLKLVCAKWWLRGVGWWGEGRETQEGRERERERYEKLWLSHFFFWQQPAQHCKIIFLQLKNFYKIKKRFNRISWFWGLYYQIRIQINVNKLITISIQDWYYKSTVNIFILIFSSLDLIIKGKMWVLEI